MNFDIELVGKIGSMALIDKANNDIDYNIFARISRELVPGYIFVSSGATEIGRLDFLKRNNFELSGNSDELKTDYAAQGQAVLMQNYRHFIDSKYSVRQLLVEHQHFNDATKRKHIRNFLLRCKEQNAIPIVNYNDAVSFEENRKMEILALLQKNSKVVECVDNDETASQISCLVKSKYLLIYTSVDGILQNPDDPDSLITHVSGKDADEVIANIDALKDFCVGTSRKGSNGAKAKLEFVKEPIMNGTTVFIANSRFSIKEVLSGGCKSTKINIS